MSYNTLISAELLHALLQAQQPVMVFDCSYDLSDPAAGQQQFVQAHIPHARYVHLHDHLSSDQPERAASRGRHPLPLPEDFCALLNQWGFGSAMQAVVYDRNGCNFCGRLWWMLKWLGHDAVAILDGGLQAWQAAGYATATGMADRENTQNTPQDANHFTPAEPLVELVSTEAAIAGLANRDMTFIDARAPARFRGEVEPLDAAAGHIPGAINRPFSDNLDANGHFKSAADLHQELATLLPTQPRKQTVVYCGSGVSAIPTLLALELAGYERPALYASSWSAWSSTPGLPVAQGSENG